MPRYPTASRDAIAFVARGDLWSVPLAGGAARRLLWKGTDTAPMWFETTIYFLSDRDAAFRANIWAHDTERRTVRQVTHFGDFDIDWPSLAGNTITFQQGGKLFALDLPSEHLREVAAEVPDDGAQTKPRAIPVGKAARTKDARRSAP